MYDCRPYYDPALGDRPPVTERSVSGRPCPRCGNAKFYWLIGRRLYKCAACMHNYSDTSDTLWHGSKLARETVEACRTLIADTKGISILALSEKLKLNYKTAYRLYYMLKHESLPPKDDLQCENCGTGFSDKDGRKAYDLRRGRIAHVFCTHECAMAYRCRGREHERCKGCDKSRRELSTWTHTHATGVHFSHGYCQPCYRKRLLEKQGPTKRLKNKITQGGTPMRYGEDHEVSASCCTACGKTLNSARAVDDDGTPSPGDIAFCTCCGHIQAFGEDLQLRDLTDAKMLDIAGDHRILALQKARLGVKS